VPLSFTVTPKLSLVTVPSEERRRLGTDGYVTRWFDPARKRLPIHLGTGRARCRAASSIESRALPLTQAATLFYACRHHLSTYTQESVIDCFQVAADVASMCLNSIANERQLITGRYHNSQAFTHQCLQSGRYTVCNKVPGRTTAYCWSPFWLQLVELVGVLSGLKKMASK